MKNFISKTDLQKLIEDGLTTKEISQKLNVGYSTVTNYCRLFNLKPISKINKHSEETKKKLSIAAKKWIKEYPEKFFLYKKDKRISKPCQEFKKVLKDMEIQFVEEFPPNVPGRNFSIDIAFPDKMIALEINGTFHYEKNGNLKPYYQERHDLIESLGWKVYEIPYYLCYKPEKVKEFVSIIQDSNTKIEFDYLNFNIEQIKNNYKKNTCPICGAKKLTQSKTCFSCFNKHVTKKTKIMWPSKEEMQILLWEKPKTHIARDLGVSDQAVEKFCKKHNLIKPPIGYWQKSKL